MDQLPTQFPRLEVNLWDRIPMSDQMMMHLAAPAAQVIASFRKNTPDLTVENELSITEWVGNTLTNAILIEAVQKGELEMRLRDGQVDLKPTQKGRDHVKAEGAKSTFKFQEDPLGIFTTDNRSGIAGGSDRGSKPSASSPDAPAGRPSRPTDIFDAYFAGR